jgi:hypothetical protein
MYHTQPKTRNGKEMKGGKAKKIEKPVTIAMVQRNVFISNNVTYQ